MRERLGGPHGVESRGAGEDVADEGGGREVERLLVAQAQKLFRPACSGEAKPGLVAKEQGFEREFQLEICSVCRTCQRLRGTVARVSVRSCG